nr:MAG: putative RNA-dependent RNA polymerase [Barnaviridae sp.]
MSAYYGWLEDVVVERLKKMLTFDLTQELVPEDLVRDGYADAVKLFVKNEPHKKSKLDEGKLRLIFSVSVVENMICALLCAPQNKVEIANWKDIPSCPGIGFHDEGVDDFCDTVRENFPQGPKSSDVSGWDWSFKQHNYDFDAFRRAICNNGFGTEWYHCIRVHYRIMANKVMTTSDGKMYAQVIPGVMASGWLNTSATNSGGRVGEVWFVQWDVNQIIDLAQQPKAAGDDCLEKEPCEPRDDVKFVEAYKKQGKIIKTVINETLESFEFCSTRYNAITKTAYPVNEAKQMFNLLHYCPVDKFDAFARLEQYRYGNRNNPNYKRLLAVVVASGWVADHCVASGIGSPLSRFQNCPSVLTQMPRDCTESFVRSFEEMYSPFCHEASNTMTRKNKKGSIKKLVKKVAAMKVAAPKKKKATPMADAGAILGNRFGGLFGRSGLGQSVGRWLGSGIGAITGTGDYQVLGPETKYNVLQGQIPKFDSTKQTNIVCHREYLGDIQGTVNFSNLQYPLNPGIAGTFPWLSQIAANYQQYRFHGIIFEFRPLLTDFVPNGAPGVVVMATNYNSDELAYTTRQEMENSEYAVSVKPTAQLIHMIECAVDMTQTPIKNIRTGVVATDQDLRLYDQGLFQFATQNNPVQALGELWVSYCVEFFKPVLAQEQLISNAMTAHVTRTGVSAANPMGTTTIASSGALSLLFASGTNVAVLNATPNIVYNINIVMTSTGTATANVAQAATLVNCTTLSWNSGPNTADSSAAVVSTGLTSNAASLNFFVRCVPTSNSFNISFLTTGTYPAGNTTIEVLISECDPTLSG